LRSEGRMALFQQTFKESYNSMSDITIHRSLNNEVKDSGENDSQNFLFQLMADDFGAFLGYMSLFMVIITVFVVCVKSFIQKYCCHSSYCCCYYYSRSTSDVESQQPQEVSSSPNNNIGQDSRIATNLRRQQIDDEEQTLERRMKRRRMRKSCYGNALKKYTLILGEQHLYACDDNDMDWGGVGKAHDNDDDDEIGKWRLKCSIEKQSETRKIDVEAYCAICLSCYEPGDKIVWSPTCTRCPHIFHFDCILTWISLGKRNCPCCREFFTEKINIDKQFQDDESNEEELSSIENENDESGELDIEQHPQQLTTNLTSTTS